MAVKVAKNTYPMGTHPDNFKCYGPPAEKDTEFDNCKMTDMGCFTQDGKDSNKYFHVAVCTAGTQWYVYTEYGRQGAGKPQFQFIQCSSESEAQKEFIKKCQEKNTKRGKWDTVGGIKMYVPKPGKDLYTVRQLAKRTHGLPDAQTISVTSALPVKKKKSAKKKKLLCDAQTTSLMRDLLGGTVQYTRSTLQGGTLPVQTSIDEARDMLQSAKKRLVKVGDDVDDQVNDKEIKQITYALYSRIPKKKPLHSHESDWILSKDNIFNWEQDLDAFETALSTGSVQDIAEDDPMSNMPFHMEWVDPHSKIGEWLYKWWPAASKNKHTYLGNMKIKNLWKVERKEDDARFTKELDQVGKNIKTIEERPLFQDKKRMDLSVEMRKKWWNANVGMLFHGTRSVNVAGILKTNLKLPKELTGVVITGAMFGGAIYMADDWKKSAGYTSLKKSIYSKGSGHVQGRQAFMFICDCLLGQPFVAPGPRGYTSPPVGYDCVFGKGGYSQVQNNEWMIYKNNRVMLRYLAEFTC